MESSAFIAYAAGFFDGEGSIDIRYSLTSARRGKQYERFQLRVSVVQIMLAPLELLKAKWAGSICRRANGVHNWAIQGPSAAQFLADILPFLIVKLDEAKIGLEFQKTITERGSREGQRHGSKLSPEIRQKRYDLIFAMRDTRLAKGIKAKPRAHVPQERVH